MGTPDKDEMTFEVFRNAVDPLIAGGERLSICFMGGEPTLHPQLPDMIQYIKSRCNAYIDMNTNGTRLHLCGKELVDAGMDAIYVSLDGSNAEVNDRGRGNHAFEKALRGLEFIQQLRTREGLPVKLAINHTVTIENYHDIVDMANFASQIGVDELFLNLTIFVRQDEGLTAQKILDSELGISFNSWQGFVIDPLVDNIDQDLLISQLEELTKQEWDFDLFLAPVGYSINELAHYFTPKWSQILKEKSCPVQTFRTTVLPNGDIIPCTIYPDIVVGNIKNNTLDKIWHGEMYSSFRKLVMNRLLPTCKRCCDLFDESQGDPYAFVNGSRMKYQL
jgi:radical SAM protein with 4Fe4S-binding SPASM domain